MTLDHLKPYDKLAILRSCGLRKSFQSKETVPDLKFVAKVDDR